MEKNGTISKKKNTTVQNNSLDYSKGELTFKNIIIPNSQYSAKWNKEDGYSVGIENIKLSKNYPTLEEALNTIGYGVDKDKEGDEILVKVGETDFEMIARVVKALITINNENNEKNN